MNAEAVEGEVRQLDVVLATGTEFRGVARHMERGVLVEAPVYLQRLGSARDRYELKTRTSTLGEFVFKAVPPGEYSFAVGGFGRSLRRVAIRIPAGGSFERSFVFGVPRIVGRVCDAVTREPVSGAQVRARSRQARATTTDSDGGFKLCDLEAGTIEIRVMREGYGLATVSADVPRDGYAELPIELEPAATLELEVTDGAGNPITGLLVLSVRPRDRSSGGTKLSTHIRTNGSGRADYREILPGDYRIVVSLGRLRGEESIRVSRGVNVLRIRLRD
jgi:hypothetical protein